MSDTNIKLRKLLKSIYDDLIDAESGDDRKTFGFKHRLKVIHENLTALEPKLVSEFSQLDELGMLGNFEETYYHKGDSGMAQLLKSRIKTLSIEINANLESNQTLSEIDKQEMIKTKISNSLVFGNILRLNNRELNAIFFQVINDGSIKINSHVNETGLDLDFKLMLYDEYLKLRQYWDIHPSNPRNPSGVYTKTPEKPRIDELFSRRTNIVEQNFDVKAGVKYAWVFNNTYSRLQDKTVTTKIEINDKKNSIVPKSNLPIMDLLRDSIPRELLSDLNDANDCYLQNHFRQCTIMLRKSLETAIKLKILQAKLKQEILLNKDGNELRLSEKLDVLIHEKLISSKTKGDVIDTVKWFGDAGVHTKMGIVEDDIRNNIEPKFRKFITELTLTP